MNKGWIYLKQETTYQKIKISLEREPLSTKYKKYFEHISVEFYTCAYLGCAEMTCWPASELWWRKNGFYCPDCIKDIKGELGPSLEEVILIRDGRIFRMGCVFNKVESANEDWRVLHDGDFNAIIRVTDIKTTTGLIKAWKRERIDNYVSESIFYTDRVRIIGDRCKFVIADHRDRVYHFDTIAEQVWASLKVGTLLTINLDLDPRV